MNGRRKKINEKRGNIADKNKKYILKNREIKSFHKNKNNNNKNKNRSTRINVLS